MDASELVPVAAGSAAAVPAGYRVTAPVPDDVWSSLTDGNPHARVFQTQAWMRALCSGAPYRDASRLYVAPDGRQLVLPLARHRLAPVAASLPHGWGAGGLVSREPERPDDVAACLADLSGLGLAKVSVTADPLRAGTWRAAMSRGAGPPTRVEERTTHVVDLRDGFDHFWSNVLDSSMRAKVRRAERLGVDVEFTSNARGIDAFYTVYLGWLDERADRRHLPRSVIRALGRRRDPRRKLEALGAQLDGEWRTWLARHDGRVVAATIEVAHGEHAMYFRGASDRDAVRRTRANELLQCRMIEHACTLGCRWYDMGESSGVESLEHFKRRFGAVEHHKLEVTIESRAAARVGDVRDALRAWSEPVRRRYG